MCAEYLLLLLLLLLLVGDGPFVVNVGVDVDKADKRADNSRGDGFWKQWHVRLEHSKSNRRIVGRATESIKFIFRIIVGFIAFVGFYRRTQGRNQCEIILWPSGLLFSFHLSIGMMVLCSSTTTFLFSISRRCKTGALIFAREFFRFYEGSDVDCDAVVKTYILVNN